MTDDARISAINRSVYEKPDVVDDYAGRYLERGLLPSEQAILASAAAEIAEQPILDIGVGGGRTTEALRSYSKEYTGVDYAEPMVNRCLKQFPGVDFRHRDAADLYDFEDQSQAMVFFSFNGIDHVRDDLRRSMMREIYRVLRPRGLFVFSSHNLRYTRMNPFDPAFFRLGPGYNLVGARRYVKRIINYLRNRKHEIHAADHAFVVDQAHGFSLLLYYITAENQQKQLRELGFGGATMYGLEGQILDPASEHDDAWIYYVCRRLD